MRVLNRLPAPAIITPIRKNVNILIYPSVNFLRIGVPSNKSL